MKFFLKKRYFIALLFVGFFYLGTSFKTNFFEIAKQIEIFTSTFKTVNQNYVDEVNAGELMNTALKKMLSELDPYTVFFNEQDVIKYRINQTGEYTGIGASIKRKEDYLLIKEIYEGFAADKANLKAGDKIYQINDIVLKNYTDDVSQLLKGTKNTAITIYFTRQNKKQTTQVILNEVTVKAVPFYTLLNDNATGYIVLQKFTKTASREVQTALEELKRKGATKLILDLRNNPGGLLQEAVKICNLFVPKGELIVTTKSKNKKHNTIFSTKNNPIDLKMPLAIIINERSASASEIVSGALQDLDRAVILGAKSFGKGLVQRPLNLPYGTQVKVTISRYYTPSGRCIQALDYAHKDKNGKAVKKDKADFNEFYTKSGRKVYDGGGITPDIIITETGISPIGKSLQKNDAIFDFVTQLYFENKKTISNNDFASFKTFIKDKKYKLNTATEKALENVLITAKKEGINKSIKQQYETLAAAITNSENIELEEQKEEIKRLLQEELIVRNEYKTGLYNYYIKNNKEIKEATTILTNASKYNKILIKQ